MSQHTDCIARGSARVHGKWHSASLAVLTCILSSVAVMYTGQCAARRVLAQYSEIQSLKAEKVHSEIVYRPIQAAIKPVEERSVRCSQFHVPELVASIHEASRRTGIPENVLLSILYAESGLNPRAVSPKGAVGIAQLSPETIQGFKTARPFNPEWSINMGAEVLRRNLVTFHGDLAMALAAYNAGPAPVLKAGTIPNIPETRNYVRKVTRGIAAGDAVARNVPVPRS